MFSKWWVAVPLLAILLILGLGGAYFAPRERRLAELARRDIDAAGAGEVVFSKEYEDLGRQVGTVGAMVAVLVVIVIFIMVTVRRCWNGRSPPGAGELVRGDARGRADRTLVKSPPELWRS